MESVAPYQKIVFRDIVPVTPHRYAAKAVVGDDGDDRGDPGARRTRNPRAPGCGGGAASVHEPGATTERSTRWQSQGLHDAGGGRVEGTITIDEPGDYEFEMQAWFDRFATWRRDLSLRAAAGDDLDLEFEVGARLIERLAPSVPKAERPRLADAMATLRSTSCADRVRLERRHRRRDRRTPRRRGRPGRARDVDPPSAPGRSGARGEGRVVRVLPPVRRWLRRGLRPRGTASRRSPPPGSTCCTCRRSTRSARRTGRVANNTLLATADDVGSPWAIGSGEGGHTAVHPDLGTIDDVRPLHRTRRRARRRGGARLRAAVQPRPPLGHRAPRVVRAPCRTGRSATPRTHRRSTRTSTRSTSGPSRRRTGSRCGRRAATSWSSGSTTACRCSGSTTPTPNRSRSGGGSSREVQAAPRDRVPVRGVHRPDDDAQPRRGRLQPVVHVLHVAAHEVGADQLRRGARPRPGGGVLPSRTCGRTPRTSSPGHLRDGSRAAFAERALLAATLAPSWGVYSGYEHCENDPGARQRGVPLVREVRAQGPRPRPTGLAVAVPGTTQPRPAGPPRVRPHGLAPVPRRRPRRRDRVQPRAHLDRWLRRPCASSS